MKKIHGMSNIMSFRIRGGINNYTYTDCLEAWNLSYELGNRIFDADLRFTQDNHIVLRHEWYDDLEQNNISEDSIPTYEEFMNTPIHHVYTPMSVYTMFDFMSKYKDIYVAVDIKDDIDIIKVLVSIARENDVDLLKRIIISFYDYEDYEKIIRIYPFNNFAIRQYENSPHNYYELASFCLKNNIPVCMVKSVYLNQGDDISILTKHGIRVYAAVVNDIETYEDYVELGVSGIVSDWLREDDL